MASHEHGDYVAEALDSALGQTYGNLEVVVADDASGDGTREILEEYARGDERVRVHLGDESLGPCGRRNDAYRRSRGELICWLDSDDVWLPQKVERQVELMAARPEVGMVYTAYEAFDSDTGATLDWGDTRPRSGEHLRPLFVDGCFIGSLTIMFRRAVLEERGLPGLRDRDWAFGDDHHLYLVTSLDWEIVGIDEVLARYRRHPRNTSDAGGNFHAQRVQLLREFLGEYPEARRRLGGARRRGLARHHRLAAAHERGRGHRLRSMRHSAHALLNDPRGTLTAPDAPAARAGAATGRMLRRFNGAQ